jgi:hypothetical protein
LIFVERRPRDRVHGRMHDVSKAVPHDTATASARVAATLGLERHPPRRPSTFTEVSLLSLATYAHCKGLFSSGRP